MAKEVLLSEPPMGGGGDGGGVAAAAVAPPPPQGLGNFKGVMLCNRPMEPGQAAAAFGSGEDGQPPPFRSRVSATHGERLGLNPTAQVTGQPAKKYRNESLEKHGKWLRKLQKGMNKDQQTQAEMAQAAAEKEERVKKASAKYREEVRLMLEQRNVDHQAEMNAATQMNRVARGLVGAGEKKKPLWAMTEQEVADFDRDAAEDLIDFAEGLDYDKFIVDLEFREALNVMKDRVGLLHREQEAFKQQLVEEFNTAEDDNPADLDFIDELGESASQVGSIAGSRRRAPASLGNADDRPDWDATSSVGDGPGRDQAKSDLAKDILASNSQIRGVHSKESLQRILEKQKKSPGSEGPPSEA